MAGVSVLVLLIIVVAFVVVVVLLWSRRKSGGYSTKKPPNSPHIDNMMYGNTAVNTDHSVLLAMNNVNYGDPSKQISQSKICKLSFV